MYVHLVLACTVALALGNRVQDRAARAPSEEEGCTGASGCDQQGVTCFASCNLKLAAPGACKVRRVQRYEHGVCHAIKGSKSCRARNRWECPPNEVCHEGKGCRACSKQLGQTPACVVEALREAAYVASFGPGPVDLFPGYSRTTQADPHEVNSALQSAWSGLKPIGEASSRSGASFFKSEAGDFLIKGMARGSEYKELDKLAKEEWQEDTVLNIPVIAFPAFGNFWCVMHNSDYDFRSKLGIQPLGPVQYNHKLKWDIKPQPLISNDRAGFWDHARHLMLSEGPLLTGRLSEFYEALRRDLNVLDKQELVDYSWLIYMYQVPHGEVTVPEGTWCFVYTSMHKTLKNFQVAPSFDNVFCFALIDYSLRYDPAGSYFKRAENSIMGGKWTEYGNKFVRLTQCIFSVPVTDSEVKAELGLGALRTSFVGVREHTLAAVTIYTANPYTEAECSDYRADQCSAVVKSVKKTGKGECDAVMRLWVDSHVVRPVSQVNFCKQYMVERCLALLPKKK